MNFDYHEAFIRNIGLLSEEEQERIKKFTIAIPGMGGVGGMHLISLVRQGFENFKIADLDEYELKNFNRQYGAEIKSVHHKKASIMKKKALDINPDCKIEVFSTGINSSNINKFLSGIDLVVDGLDFFEVDIRRKLFNKSVELNIPLITAGPIGFGTAYLIFKPGGMNFDEYFGVDDKTPYEEKLLAFSIGLAPRLLQRSYMKNINFKEKKGPSSIAGVDLASGVIVVNALKILLDRGEVLGVPYYQQFDVMKNKFVKGRIFFGGKNPVQLLKRKIAKKIVKLE